MRDKEHGRSTTIKTTDLLAVWDKQRGVCPYTGWQLELPPNASGWPTGSIRHTKRASIDRKDSKTGYTKKNVQFVSLMANLAKSDFTENELLAFCQAVVSNMVPAPGLAPGRVEVFETTRSAVRH